MTVFPSTAKLTGSIMIPSADMNPTRPTPPASSRSKHSAGLSVRMMRSPAAGRSAGDSRSGETLSAPRLFAGPFPDVMYSHLHHSRALSLFSLVLRRGGRCGPTSRRGGPFGTSRFPAVQPRQAQDKRRSSSRRRNRGVIVLVLSRADVEAVLDLDRLLDAVAAAMVDLSHGRASMPPRVAASIPDRHAMLAAMPAFLPSTGSLCTKLVSLFPENTGRPTHQAIICCFDAATGSPAALMDGT